MRKKSVKKKKTDVLHPEFKKKIGEIFGDMSHVQKKHISDLYDIATLDEKTGLYNNKFFENILEMELEKAQRGYQKLCLFIVDIDFFKKVNDTHGHIRGDEILKRLAIVIKGQLRRSDVAARFGGEEFFVLLPQTNLEKAKLITARIREAIKSNPVLKKYKINVSGGLTCYKEKDTEKSFKERADKALYKAKETGRDKFVAID
jgi:diguanylate cyclase (GGDEF)-like protein